MMVTVRGCAVTALAMGTCQPRRVYFDVPREARPWSALETRAVDTTDGVRQVSDWNTANGEVNVGVYPDRTRIGIPFRRRSIDGAVLMFEVHGEIELTRQ